MTTTSAATTTRPLYEIAREIRSLWNPVHPWAEPYVVAMASLNLITDNYGHDDAKGIVLRFLGNARTWRGPDARRIKAELNAMVAR
ncbi:MAG TPA: hypothetical protein VME19_17685 [Streptosporangiaceae bacterium]|nr:hypothetical protein [Streptosporangiaceae bacterium]